LLLSALLKLGGLIQGPRILFVLDPILGLPNWLVYFGVAAAELGVGGYQLFGRSLTMQGISILALACNFLTYKAARTALHINEPCPCFGRISDWVPHLGGHLEAIGNVIISFMLLSSFVLFAAAVRKKVSRSNV
jgi:hypothetical protein